MPRFLRISYHHACDHHGISICRRLYTSGWAHKIIKELKIIITRWYTAQWSMCHYLVMMRNEWSVCLLQYSFYHSDTVLSCRNQVYHKGIGSAIAPATQTSGFCWVFVYTRRPYWVMIDPNRSGLCKCRLWRLLHTTKKKIAEATILTNCLHR